MFPGQQGPACDVRIWPPRFGIKLLEGAPSTEKRVNVGIFLANVVFLRNQTQYPTKGYAPHSGRGGEPRPGGDNLLRSVLKGLPNLRDRFVQYGIRMSFWGSGTLKIVIYVENYPQKRCFRLVDYHPLWGWGGVN
jgi:hypothetical protein